MIICTFFYVHTIFSINTKLITNSFSIRFKKFILVFFRGNKSCRNYVPYSYSTNRAIKDLIILPLSIRPFFNARLAEVVFTGVTKSEEFIILQNWLKTY